MKSYDFEAVVFNECHIACVECLPEEYDIDSDEVSPIFADSEWDSAPVCDICGCEHTYMNILGDY